METDKNIKDLNLWQRLTNIRIDFDNLNLKRNAKSNYSLSTGGKVDHKFYDLPYIMPKIIRLFKQYNLSYSINFANDTAQMKVININKLEEIEYFSIPCINVSNLKNMQDVGKIVTYATRYLMYICLAITENDVLDIIGYENVQSNYNKDISENQKNNQNLNSDNKSYNNITREKKLIEIGDYLNKNNRLEKALKHFKVVTLNKLKDKDLDWIIDSYKIKF